MKWEGVDRAEKKGIENKIEWVEKRMDNRGFTMHKRKKKKMVTAGNLQFREGKK